MALKLRKNARQPRVLPDFDPAGLVLVEIFALHQNHLIHLITERPSLEVAGREVLCQHADGFDLRAPTIEEVRNCFAKDLVTARGFVENLQITSLAKNV